LLTTNTSNNTVFRIDNVSLVSDGNLASIMTPRNNRWAVKQDIEGKLLVQLSRGIP